MTEFSYYISNRLMPNIKEEAVVLDLFAGCGGLFLGCEKNLLFLIEAYHSSNPMNGERVSTLKQLVVDSGANVVYVTAFLNKREGLKHLKELAWETEVWFANEPEHMIHLNGCKFLEIYNKDT